MNRWKFFEWLFAVWALAVAGHIGFSIGLRKGNADMARKILILGNRGVTITNTSPSRILVSITGDVITVQSAFDPPAR